MKITKNFLTAGVAAAALCGASAYAADLPAKAPYYKAAPIEVYNWTGFYVGGNLGYGWGGGNTDFAPSAALNTKNTTVNTKAKGAIGGAQIGYNYQFGSFMAGLEADIQGSGIKGDATGPIVSVANVITQDATHFTSASMKLPWFGTVRGRIGFTAMPDLLLYGTGGFAYGKVENFSQMNGFGTIFPAQVNQTKVGWTGGAGAEWMFAHNWSAKLEYLYLNLGKTSVTADLFPTPFPGLQVGNTWHNQDHIIRVGVNYHFGGY